MESADAVYGITMSEDGVSQAISLRLESEKAAVAEVA
jgi:chromosome segregation ATPase